MNNFDEKNNYETEEEKKKKRQIYIEDGTMASFGFNYNPSEVSEED